MPRIAPDIAPAATPPQTRLETDIAIHSKTCAGSAIAIIPMHRHFATFKAATLARYGVTSVEDLPGDDRGGWLAMEGERYHRAARSAHARRSLRGSAARAPSPRASAWPAKPCRRFACAAHRWRWPAPIWMATSAFWIRPRSIAMPSCRGSTAWQAEAATHRPTMAARNKDPEVTCRVRISTLARHGHDVPDFTIGAAPLAERVQAAAPAWRCRCSG